VNLGGRGTLSFFIGSDGVDVEVGRPADAVEAVDVVDMADPRWMSSKHSERHGERGRHNGGSQSFIAI
jgi:hypothetical protein